MPLNRGMPTLALAVFSWPSFNTGADVDFHHKGISATRPLATPIGKSSLSYEGEGSPLWL